MAVSMDPVEALKWVAIVFVGGFIAYFGKYLSKLILARIHKSGPEGRKKEAPAKPAKTKEELEYDLEKKRLKLEKKRIKALKKSKG